MTIAEAILEQVQGGLSDFRESWIEHEDSVLIVTGIVQEDWRYDTGDYFTPPDYTFIGRYADLYRVAISYNDGTEKVLTDDELYELEREIEEL